LNDSNDINDINDSNDIIGQTVDIDDSIIQLCMKMAEWDSD
jgi:hypothetical protein